MRAGPGGLQFPEQPLLQALHVLKAQRELGPEIQVTAGAVLSTVGAGFSQSIPAEVPWRVGVPASQ